MGGEVAGGFVHPPRVSQICRHSNALFVIGLLVLPLAFVACSPGRQGDQAGSLEERVKEVWEARIAGDDSKAYTFEAYSKTRRMTANQYVRSRGPVFKYKSSNV